MKKVKKLSALLLSLCMAFVFVASTAFAAEQVADADGITITADTTDEAIAAAWGEGAAAISQNDDGSYTFKLLKNISLAKYQDISIGNFQAGAEQPRIILDLNGCTLSGTSIVIANLGNLTIMDGSAEQTGRIEYNGGQYLVAVNNVGYSMTIEGGTFVCNGADSAAYNSAISTAGGVTTVINGGTFEGNGAGAVISYGETVINGGTFDGAYGVVSKKTSSGETGSIVFPADSTAVINASKIAFVAQGDAASAGKVSAAGGTFNAPAVLGTIGTGVDKTSAANVTGGIYAADPSAYVPDNNASISYTHENSTVYAVGKSSIDEVAQQAQAGDTITVLSGDVALDTADKVVVKNESTGNVVVNGTTVETNTEVTATFMIQTGSMTIKTTGTNVRTAVREQTSQPIRMESGRKQRPPLKPKREKSSAPALFADMLTLRKFQFCPIPTALGQSGNLTARAIGMIAPPAERKRMRRLTASNG